MRRENEGGLKSIADWPPFRALRRARAPIFTIALTYFIFFLTGLAMVHAGSKFALNRRDRLVTHGESQDAAAIAFQHGKRLKAASIESGRDSLRALTRVLEGLTVVVPYPSAAYTGWYRGILSVDSAHRSRVADPFDALYFLMYQLLQGLSSSLAAGAGVNLMLAVFRKRPWYAGRKLLGVSIEALHDLLRMYLLAVALIFVASFWEYFFL